MGAGHPPALSQMPPGTCPGVAAAQSRSRRRLWWGSPRGLGTHRSLCCSAPSHDAAHAPTVLGRGCCPQGAHAALASPPSQHLHPGHTGALGGLLRGTTSPCPRPPAQSTIPRSPTVRLTCVGAHCRAGRPGDQRVLGHRAPGTPQSLLCHPLGSPGSARLPRDLGLRRQGPDPSCLLLAADPSEVSWAQAERRARPGLAQLPP